MLTTLRHDIDYRIIYTREAEFHKRMRDIYIARQTHKNPPSFEALLEELMEYDVWLFLFDKKEADGTMTPDEREHFLHELQFGDMESLYQFSEKGFMDLFARDLFLFLTVNRFFFIERDAYERSHVTYRNPALQEVW